MTDPFEQQLVTRDELAAVILARFEAFSDATVGTAAESSTPDGEQARICLRLRREREHGLPRAAPDCVEQGCFVQQSRDIADAKRPEGRFVPPMVTEGPKVELTDEPEERLPPCGHKSPARMYGSTLLCPVCGEPASPEDGVAPVTPSEPSPPGSTPA